MEHDELTQHLESLQRESCYRVDAILKESPVEITQRVFFTGDNGAEAGPYIRKFIKRGFGIGGAYERIFTAQQRGHRFKYIPDMLECYTRDNELVVVMELVRGQTLQDAVYERDPSVQLAREIFPKLCDAVSELHCEFDPPIIHRDLKPSNIILTGEGLALIDFGISREYDEGADVDTTHFGTREFAPPEQYGFGQTGTYSDVYSLGMVLYFCLTEKIPTSQDRSQAFCNPGIPEAYRQVIAKAAALDPAMRFASADELKRAFLAASSENAYAAQRSDQVGQSSYRNTISSAGNASAPNAGYSTDGTANWNANSNASGNISGKPKRSRTPVVIAVIAVICLALIGNFLLNAKGTSSEQTSSSQSQTSASEQTASESAQSNAATSTSAPTTSPDESASGTEEEIATDLDNQASPKNGFDPTTNDVVQVAEVEFQIPRYFLASTSASEDGQTRYYYAEQGSSVAMLMTSESFIGESAGRAEFEAAKDDYLSGMMESDALEEITSSTDYELAGLSARVVTITGSIKGIPIAAKAAFFFNPDSHSVGIVMFGQSNNAQFDYSLDFAKVITSAKRV